MLDLAIVRLIFVLVLAVAAYTLHPFQTLPWQAGVGGLVLGASIILFEIRLERISLKRLIGAACGS
ncbi:MAG TPA: PIN domain nuclease, partial [Terriglobia bacterium]|nr:PIN domain nuclease [Terriglobia bacterium]